MRNVATVFSRQKNTVVTVYIMGCIDVKFLIRLDSALRAHLVCRGTGGKILIFTAGWFELDLVSGLLESIMREENISMTSIRLYVAWET